MDTLKLLKTRKHICNEWQRMAANEEQTKRMIKKYER